MNAIRRRTYSSVSSNERGFRYVLTDKGIIDFDLIEDCLDTGKLPIISGTENYYNTLAYPNSKYDINGENLPGFLMYNSSELNSSILMRIVYRYEEKLNMSSFSIFPLYECEYGFKKPQIGEVVKFEKYPSYKQQPKLLFLDDELQTENLSAPIKASVVTSSGKLVMFISEGALSNYLETGILIVNKDSIIEDVIYYERLPDSDSDYGKTPFSFPYSVSSFGFVLPVSKDLILISIRSGNNKNPEICYVLDVTTKDYWLFDTVPYSLYCLF